MKYRNQTLKSYIRQLFDDEGSEGGNDENGDGDGAQGDDEGKPAAKYTDADLDKIINRKFAEWQKKQQKAVDEAKKLAEMTAQERAEHERDELQKELDALKKEKTRAALTTQGRKILSENGITISEELLALMIADDAETTKAAVESFTKQFKAAVQAGIKDALKGKTPAAGAEGTITKEEILKIADRAERQRMISEHMDLFRK